MRHKLRKHGNKPLRKATLARINTAVATAADTVIGRDRHRFAWGFIVSLSVLALGTYHPAMAQDKRWQEWKQGPHEPDHDSGPRADTTTSRRASDWNGRTTRTTDYDRGAAPPLRTAANEESPGGSKQPFDVPEGDLEGALLTFSRQAGLQILYSSELVAGLRSRAVQGDYTPDEALNRVLGDTGLRYRYSNPTTITLHRTDAQGAAAAAPIAGSQAQTAKPVKVPEVVVKEVVDRTPANDPPDGYKADYSSTVTRSTLPIDETPTSIGVVTRDMIRDTFARSQMDAFEAVSGITRNNTFGRGEGFSIRGFQAQNHQGDFNALRSNGLPIDGVWAPDWGIVERYEIVKGPASIVGGASTPGGVINRITKTPLRTNFTTTEFQAGSYGFLRGMVDANAMLPAHEDVRGRLVVAVEDEGNFVDNTPVRQYTVAPSAEFDLFKGAGKLLVVGMYQHFDGAIYPGYPLSSDATMLNVPRTRNFGGGAPNGARTTYTGYNGEIHYNHRFIHDIKLSVKGKYSNSYLSDKTIYAYTAGGIPPSGDTYVTAGLQQNRFDTYAGELFLSKEFDLFGQKHEILAGVDHRDMTQNYLTGYIYLPSNDAPVLDNVFNPVNGLHAPPDSVLAAAARQPFRSKLKQTGAFAQAVIRPIERLTLVFAGRHDTADSLFFNKLSLVQTEQTKSAWTGRAGATFKVTHWMNVYGGLQQSFQPQPFGVSQEGKMLEPETGINYEVGAKFNLLEDRLRITTALFRTYRENVSTPDPNNNRFVIGVGEQRHQGVELDINGQPIPGLNLNANFAYLDAEITKDARPGFVGQRAVAPQYVGRVFATYELQSGLLQGFGFGGGVYFVGDYDVQLPNRVKVDPYERVDGVLFYRGNKRWDVSFNVRNLLNAKYIENPGTINWANRFGAPITAFGTVRVFF